MTPFVQDTDFTLYVGDALEVLRTLPDASVHCCVTSPPYWGLRDYGTGSWDGGDPDCDHVRKMARNDPDRDTRHTDGRNPETQGMVGVQDAIQFSDVCGKCGATRVDHQLGLEPTPDEFVAAIVNVFREVRRVLRADGTLWLNLGDSYASSPASGGEATRTNTGSLHQRTPLAPYVRPDGLKPKDLCGIPWRVAFALQADGWYLRSAITWCKLNAMPESVTDRPTKATEMIFLLTRSPRYYYDAESIREPHQQDGRRVTTVVGQEGSLQHRNGERWPGSGANARDWWPMATQAFPEAHFATFPEALPERCIKAGTSERGCCPVCGAPWVRLVDRRPNPAGISGGEHREVGRSGGIANGRPRDYEAERSIGSGTTIDWSPSCMCSSGNSAAYVTSAQSGHSPSQPSPNSEYDLPQDRHFSTGGSLPPVPCTVLDPFLGSGTTALVARRLGRRSIGIELSAEYAELAARRLQQLSLLAEPA